MHHPLARLVVARAQLLGRADARDADPLAAVERLHEERVADVLADRLEVERRVVALGRSAGSARLSRRHLVRDQPRLGHADAEPHQRAVGGVLLHRLERERVVQQVDVVHQRDLLQPRARQVVPPREPVDDERVARPVAQVERLVEDRARCVSVVAAVDRPERARRAPRTRPASPPRCRAAGRSGAKAHGVSTPTRRAEPPASVERVSATNGRNFSMRSRRALIVVATVVAAAALAGASWPTRRRSARCRRVRSRRSRRRRASSSRSRWRAPVNARLAPLTSVTSSNNSKARSRPAKDDCSVPTVLLIVFNRDKDCYVRQDHQQLTKAQQT